MQVSQAQIDSWTEIEKSGRITPTDLPEKCKGLPTTSAKIRALHADGYTRSQIKKMLGLKHYQHVRNVLVRQLKKVA